MEESSGLRIDVSTPEKRRGLEELYAHIEKHHDEVSAVVAAALMRHPGVKAETEKIPPEQQLKEAEESRERQRAAFKEGKWGPYFSALRDAGRRYARSQITFEHWLEAGAEYRRYLMQRLVEEHGKDPAHVARVALAMDDFVNVGVSTIGAAYVEEQERIIREHQEVIRELSTPILRISDKLLVAPVIGVVDTLRARQLTQSLLHAVRRHRARFVVLDITGVPIVDSKVANHLLQTVEAARLMGAHVIVSGIAPEIAQTLVAIGADLKDIHTVGEFDVALAEAQALLDQSTHALAARVPAPNAANGHGGPGTTSPGDGAGA